MCDFSSQSLYSVFSQCCSTHPQNTALNFLGNKVKYSELLRDVDSVAYKLVRMGVEAGDVVTICLPNTISAVTALYAVSKVGGIANMLHPLLPIDSVIAGMDKVKSELIFCLDTMLIANREKLLSHGKTAIFARISYSLKGVKRLAYSAINESKIATNNDIIDFMSLLCSTCNIDKVVSCGECDSVYLHSGGTTAEPKVVRLTANAFNNLAQRSKGILSMPDIAGKGMLAVLPMFHGFGICMCVHSILTNGGVVSLVPKFDVKTIIKVMKTQNICFMAGVPTLYDKLLQHPKFAGAFLKRLTFAFCGGDSMPESLKIKFDERMEQAGSTSRLLEGYGLTETVTVCAVNTNTAHRSGSVGRPLEGMQVEAINVTNYELLPRGELGELIVASDTLMEGYYGDEIASRQVFISKKGTRYCRTGDYGKVDEDGYIYFVSRLKRIIKINGVAVFPTEIELYASKVQGVRRCCAINTPKNDKNSITLFVEREKGADENEVKKLLEDTFSANLLRWSIPRDIKFRELPVTVVGKVDFKQLENNYNNK